MTQTDSPAVIELDAWLADFANLADTDQPKVRLAMRCTLQILAESGERPEHAQAMLAELNRRFPPRYVTAVQRHSYGRIMHLQNHFGHPVEAGEYHAPDGTVFTIAENPDARIDLDSGAILSVETTTEGVSEFVPMEALPEGWIWRAEFV